MNQNEVTIQELNAYLKGEYMAIHSYDHFIQKATDPTVKSELQRIQREHKDHAATIAERIQNLGGKAVNDNGLMLSISEGMLKLRIPDTTEGIIEKAIDGQKMGIGITEKIVRGDIDQESRQIVERNLDEDREHIQQLNNLLH